MREHLSWGRVLAAAVGGALLCAVTGYVAYVRDPGLHLDFYEQDVLFRYYLTGFFNPEPAAAADQRQSWTGPEATIRVPDLDRTVPWLIRLHLTGGRPAAADSIIVLTADGRPIANRPLPSEWESVEALIEPRPDGQRGLQLVITSTRPFAPGGSDPRTLGVLISDIQVEPAGSGRGMPSLSTLARLAGIGAAAGLVLSAAGLGLPVIASLGAVLALLLAALNNISAAGHAAYPGQVFPTVLILLGGTLVLVLWRRRAEDHLSALAWGLGGLMVLAKLLFLLHPAMTLGDMQFHLNRLEYVRDGHYFFTSSAPGGDFPYPVGMYVIASWFSWFVHDWTTSLRVLVALTDGLAGYAIFSLARREASLPAVAILAMLMYHLAPAVFQVQTIAYLPNAFGQSLAIFGAHGLSAEWQKSALRRLLAAGLTAAFAVSACAYWFAWFDRILPR